MIYEDIKVAYTLSSGERLIIEKESKIKILKTQYDILYIYNFSLNFENDNRAETS